jgi:streptomycin 6-kinase
MAAGQRSNSEKSTLAALNEYLQAWGLSNPQLLAQTVTSDVYTVIFEGHPAVLKLLTTLGQKDEKNGAIALRHFAGNGAVRLYRDDDGAHLLEYAEGEDLIALVKRGEDEQATSIIADVLNKLHAAPITNPPEGLTPLRIWFRALFKKAEAESQESIYAHGARVAENLLANPLDSYVIHGDIHHGNIRHNAQRGWLALDPKSLWGERTYDAANTLCNPFEESALVHNEARLLKNAAILAEKLNIDRARILAFTFAYACLSVSWSLEAGDEPEHLAIAQIIEPHL